MGKGSADLPFPAWAVAAREYRGLFGDVLGTEFHAQGNSAHLPIVEFPAGTLAFAFIESDTDVGFDKFGLQFARGIDNRRFFFVGLEDGHDDDLIRRKLLWQYQPLIVAVDHDDRANAAPGEPPRCRPAMLQLAVLVEIFDLEGLGEILSEEV